MDPADRARTGRLRHPCLRRTKVSFVYKKTGNLKGLSVAAEPSEAQKNGSISRHRGPVANTFPSGFVWGANDGAIRRCVRSGGERLY
jgi:hypothetical protein